MRRRGRPVATRVTGSGTQRRRVHGHAAVRQGSRPGARTGIFRVADGKIVEHWGMPDLLALLSQIGAIPPAGRRAAARHLGPDAAPGRRRRADPHDAAMLARNKAVVRWVYDDGLRAGRPRRLADDFVAADYVDHPPARSFQVADQRTRSSLIEDAVRVFRRAFPTSTSPSSELVAEGNRSSARAALARHAHRRVRRHPADRQAGRRSPGINFFRVGRTASSSSGTASFDVLGDACSSSGSCRPGRRPPSH